jgi:hypothetical protein
MSTRAVAEILKQARVIISERTPSSNATRQALNLIANSPRLDKDEIGPMRFKAAMSLRSHCLMYRSVPVAARPIVLTLIEQGIALIDAIQDVPADTAYQRWLQE